MQIKKRYQWQNEVLHKESKKWNKVFIWSMFSAVIIYVVAIVTYKVFANDMILILSSLCLFMTVCMYMFAATYGAGIIRADKLLKPNDIYEKEKNIWYLLD